MDILGNIEFEASLDYMRLSQKKIQSKQLLAIFTTRPTYFLSPNFKNITFPFPFSITFDSG